jgi:cell division septation protein DedD
MSKKMVFSLFFLWLAVSLAAALPQFATAGTVFYDDFSNGNLSGWSRTHISAGSNQTVNNSVAQFTVPTPTGGTVTYSAVVKDGYTSTLNSTITASQDIFVAKVPSGCQQGLGAIFFLYICDSADLSGDLGNIGVGIDGSGVWSLWIGGTTNYSYIFQSTGATPVSNTWYHVALIIDNPTQRVLLSVDSSVVVNASQRQFTDKIHSISLMAGMGESWFSTCVGTQEVDIDNVRLDISDASPIVTVNPTPTPTSTGTSSSNTGTSATAAPSKTLSPTPQKTTNPTNQATNSPTAPATATPTPYIQRTELPLWVTVLAAVVLAVCVETVLLAWKLRRGARGNSK